MKRKTIAILMAAMLICGGVAGATMAWLTASSATVTNTFTYGDINIELTEEHPVDQSAKMIPGSDIAKDPKVTVEEGSEPCYVFVKIEPSGNYSTFFGEFTAEDIAEGWIRLDNEDNVFYRIVEAADGLPLSEDTSFYILKNNKVSVLSTVTKADMEELKKDPSKYPTLSFTAYAVQLQNIDGPVEAWAQVPQTQAD